MRSRRGRVVEPERALRWVVLGIFPLGISSTLPAAFRGPCRHPSRGEVRKISLGEVRRVREELQQRLSWEVGEISRFSPDARFDSGLPACTARSVRRVPLEMPPVLVGRKIVFAPEGKGSPSDYRVATSARRLDEIRADALADRALLRRFGVRCTSTEVIVRSTEEVELVELP